MKTKYSNLLGFRVIEKASLVEDGPLVIVKRSMINRLFSWPWRPMVKEEAVVSKRPSKIIHKAGDFLIMHPLVAKKLRFYIRCNKYSLVRIYLLQYMKEHDSKI